MPIINKKPKGKTLLKFIYEKKYQSNVSAPEDKVNWKNNEPVIISWGWMAANWFFWFSGYMGGNPDNAGLLFIYQKSQKILPFLSLSSSLCLSLLNNQYVWTPFDKNHSDKRRNSRPIPDFHWIDDQLSSLANDDSGCIFIYPFLLSDNQPDPAASI